MPLLARLLSEFPALGLVLGVSIGCPAPGQLPLGHVGVPAAGEQRAVAAEIIQFQDLGRYRSQHGAVMAYDDEPGLGPPQLGLKERQAVVVQVIGRLVKQQDVRLGEQDAARPSRACWPPDSSAAFRLSRLSARPSCAVT